MISPQDRKHFTSELLSWFDRRARDLPWRSTEDPYATWVSEIMLQQTRVTTVIPYFNRWMSRFPTIETLAAASQDEVLKHWEKLGYYARARNLHKAAAAVLADFGGRVPETWDDLHRLPGVGDYVAAAVLSIAFGQPFAAVDGNVRRVLSRLFAVADPVNDTRFAKTFQTLDEQLLDHGRPGDFNQAMMELGATVCLPKTPKCSECPVHSLCEAFTANRLSEFPVRKPRKKPPHYQIAVGVVARDGCVLITRRPSEGLLGGLWEFPGGKIQTGETASEACQREIREEVGLDVQVQDRIARVEHAYTHFSIVMDVFACAYTAGEVELSAATDHRWVVAEDLDEYAFPGANHKFLDVVKERVTRE